MTFEFAQNVVNRWNMLSAKYPQNVRSARYSLAVEYELSQIVHTDAVRMTEEEVFEMIDNLEMALEQPASRAGIYILCKFLRTDRANRKFHPDYFIAEHYDGTKIKSFADQKIDDNRDILGKIL